jgi:hypothetical protein
MLQKKGCFTSDTLFLDFIKKGAKEKIREQNSHRETCFVCNVHKILQRFCHNFQAFYLAHSWRQVIL